MTDMQALTIRDFEMLKDTAFEVRSLDADLQLSLVEVKPLGSGERGGGAFSVLWLGPHEPQLEQSTYKLYQQDLGEQEIFLVPVAEKDAGIQYEAVFT
ncbi:hypothetical protein WNZ15_22540 [Roseibium sp. AS2]|uniref:DUF6916 family protein n=1 Tax=Roseibium sp. AS2 TaxID=3135781 RepID=UPI003177F1F8